MLEIILLITLWKKVGRDVQAKGHENARTYQWLLLVMWFGGEIGGIVVYAFIMVFAGREPQDFVGYAVGIALGVVAVLILFGIIRNLPQRELPEHEHYQPRQRSAL